MTIQDRTFKFDFIVLDMAGFDVILGIDWLSSTKATIDYYKCRVTVCTLKGDCFRFTGDRLDHRDCDSISRGDQVYRP